MDDAVQRSSVESSERGEGRHLEVVGRGLIADQGWRMQPYVLDEGTYNFEVDAVEGTEAAGYVFRLRVVGGSFDGHRLLVKEAAPIVGLREAIPGGKRLRLRGTIMKVRGRGRRLTHAELF